MPLPFSNYKSSSDQQPTISRPYPCRTPTIEDYRDEVPRIQTPEIPPPPPPLPKLATENVSNGDTIGSCIANLYNRPAAKPGVASKFREHIDSTTIPSYRSSPYEEQSIRTLSSASTNTWSNDQPEAQETNMLSCFKSKKAHREERQPLVNHALPQYHQYYKQSTPDISFSPGSTHDPRQMEVPSNFYQNGTMTMYQADQSYHPQDRLVQRTPTMSPTSSPDTSHMNAVRRGLSQHYRPSTSTTQGSNSTSASSQGMGVRTRTDTRWQGRWLEQGTMRVDRKEMKRQQAQKDKMQREAERDAMKAQHEYAMQLEMDA